MRHGPILNRRPKTAAAPATVSGKRPSHATGEIREGDDALRPASQETCHALCNRPSGMTDKENDMNTMTTHTNTQATTQTGGIVAAAVAMVIGLGLITAAGHLQASTLHAAAHDVRHATGFPCH